MGAPGGRLPGATRPSTGAGIATPLPTPEQEARLAQLLALTGLPESFLLTDMGFATFALHDLVYDPAKLDGAAAMHNAGVDYGDPAVNASIERVTSEAPARFFLRDHFTPSGDVGAVKIVSIHTDKDGLVFVENQSEYAPLNWCQAPP